VNFFLQDIAESAVAACLFPFFLLLPGYMLASGLDVWEFRHRTPAARLALGTVISFAVTPGVAYLLSRLWSLQFVCSVFVTGSLLFLLTRITKSRRADVSASLSALKSDRLFLQSASLAVLWMAVAIFLLSDVQVSDRLYPNVVAHDYAWRVAVTGAITHTDVPPINPDFYPGHPIQLYYYYFWFMTCSLIDLLGGSWVGPRGALAAGAGWVGIGIMAIVALYVRLFASDHPLKRPRHILIALVLLTVTGFDIVPLLIRLLYQMTEGNIILYPSSEWWNEAIGGWPHSIVWVPHHMAGLIATLAVFLIFSDLHRTRTSMQWTITAMMCSVGFFSALGMSVWMAFVFAVFWAIWILISYRKGWYAEARAGAFIAVVGAILSIPYLIDLHRANFTDVIPVVVAVRMFSPVHQWLQHHHAGLRRLFVGDLVSLPLNYFLEFGFFALAAMVYWRRRWKIRTPLDRNEIALVTLAAVALFIGSFLRSNIVNNDLGYRSILFVQFVVLIWSSDVLQALLARMKGQSIDMPISRVMAILLLLSAAIGTLPLVYEAAIMKLYAMAGDLNLPARRVFPFLNEANLGRRYYDFREAYHWIHRHLPESAILQHNPDLYMDVPSGLYGNRQVVASDRYYGPQFGIRQDMFEPIFSAIAPIFTSNAVNRADVSRLCRRFGIAALVVKDTDPIWNHPESWIFRETPVFANRSSRVFYCGPFLASAETGG